MIGFSFTYAEDGHEVKADIRGLVLRASGWWGYLSDQGTVNIHGRAAAGAVTLDGRVIEDLLLLAPKEGRIGLRDGARGTEACSVKGPLAVTSSGAQLELRERGGEALARACEEGWCLLGSRGEPMTQLGDELILVQSQLARLEPVRPLGPRARLSALAERLLP